MSSKNVRMSGPALLTGAAATKYTTPGSTITVLQHIHVENPTAGAIGFTLSIGADAAGTRLYDNFTIAGGAVLDQFCKYVLNPADIVQAFASVAGVATLTLDGQELTPG